MAVTVKQRDARSLHDPFAELDAHNSGLARLLGEVVFARLVTRFRRIEREGEIVRERRTTPRIYASVPIAVSAA